MKTNLLGGITPTQFLAEYWQKKPLLVRGAIRDFTGPLSRDEVLSLACEDDPESRLIRHDGQQWQLSHGPFSPRDFKKRGAWTVLVQGVNLFSDAADALLQRFDFIPAARLDDLMVSYATDGGGVGPHFDSYDVFLLQGMGRRRWRIGKQRDLTLVPDAPLRILRDFRPTEEWALEPGDMLYLPPQYAHDGVAEGECMTWSIGFRAPSAQELACGFLEHLIERLDLPGRYADPDLKLLRHRAELGADMLDRVAAMIDKVSWNRAMIRDFLGCYLSEPKQSVFFDTPERPMSESAFEKKLASTGVRLDRKTQLLFSGCRFYINGEAIDAPAGDKKALQKLADDRSLPAPLTLSGEAMTLLHSWYRNGFILPGTLG